MFGNVGGNDIQITHKMHFIYIYYKKEKKKTIFQNSLHFFDGLYYCYLNMIFILHPQNKPLRIALERRTTEKAPVWGTTQLTLLLAFGIRTRRVVLHSFSFNNHMVDGRHQNNFLDIDLRWLLTLDILQIISWKRLDLPDVRCCLPLRFL